MRVEEFVAKMGADVCGSKNKLLGSLVINLLRVCLWSRVVFALIILKE